MRYPVVPVPVPEQIKAQSPSTEPRFVVHTRMEFLALAVTEIGKGPRGAMEEEAQVALWLSGDGGYGCGAG